MITFFMDSQTGKVLSNKLPRADVVMQDFADTPVVSVKELLTKYGASPSEVVVLKAGKALLPTDMFNVKDNDWVVSSLTIGG